LGIFAVAAASQARGETATKLRPGATIQAFCEPLTTTSRPQASVSNGTAPRPEIASTRTRASGATPWATLASASIGLVTAVEVSFWVIRTAFHGPPAFRASRTFSGSAALPHSKASLVTSAP